MIEQNSGVAPLDPMTLPLAGNALIEASAGTGKTFTLAALYLRLLLGHGGQAPLGVDQILVVTFTEAATAELRERIRDRIRQARLAFLSGQTEDPILQQLLDGMASEHWPRAASDLEFAASEMDLAAIFTIHGFCQRALRQHAFESGASFAAELTPEDLPLVRRALLDYWRAELYLAPAELAGQILSLYRQPDALLAKLRPYLALDELQLVPDYSDFALAERWHQQQQMLETAREQLAQLQEPLFYGQIIELVAGSSVNKRSYSKKNVPNWLAKLLAFAEGGAPCWSEFERFAQSSLEQSASDAAKVPRHPLFETLEQVCQARVPLAQVVFCRALSEVRKRLAEDKQRLGLMAFDDLLGLLSDALAGPRGELLASALRQQYPFALIDEFQDTDPRQYSIFDTLYASDEALGLLMIGDPKQAIYAFRGADIFTYIRARRATEKHYTLATNWRSSSQVVASVNRLFESADQPFIYDQDIPFVPVAAAGRGDATELLLAGKKQPALTFWHSDQPVSGDGYLQQMADYASGQIERLLAEGSLGDEPLLPTDIAVLVRDRREAAMMARALDRRAIDSVFMSNRDSVFSTTLAQDIYFTLQAVSEPSDERALRSALSCALFEWDALALDRLNSDETALEALVEEFNDYRQVWLSKGVLAFLHRLLEQRDLSQRWAACGDGERRTTDFLHLAELLQSASEQREPAALLRWLADRLDDPNGQAGDQQLRLDSDRSRVTIMTIHKSKGLEFEVVMLPFICRYREGSAELYHDESGRAKLDLDNSEQAKTEARREQLAEDLRLLYVALTRAAKANYLGMANIHYRNKPVLAKTAIGYLLNVAGQTELSLEALLEPYCCEFIDALAVTESLQQEDLFAALPQAQATAELAARVYSAPEPKRWRMTSYSALSRQVEAPVGATAGVDLEVLDEVDDTPAQLPDELPDSLFSFHRGAAAGTFLHSIYENIDFATVTEQQLAECIEHQLQLAGFESRWVEPLTEPLWQSLDVPLMGQSQHFSLRQIGAKDRLVEMEFTLAINRLNANALNDLIARFEPLAARAGRLLFEQIEGALKGFIDLTCRVDGRYYVIDYKSNYLGDKPSDYQREALELAMIDHRYDLQYLLYTLALHRLLAQRLPDYQYESHMGGVFYLFLRGMSLEEPGAGVFYRLPDKALIEALDQLFSGEPI